MKSLKFTLSIFTFFLFIGSGFCQSAKMVQKATAKVEKLNTAIASVDADLALDQEQTKKITELYTKMFVDVKAAKKSGLEGEELKAKQKEIRKITSKEINKNILTKAQRQAKKTAKATAKG